MEYKVLTTAQELSDFCNTSSDVSWLALDTEFIREKTYYPNLCLIQIATEHNIVCIDTIAIKDLTSLKELLYQPSITKIFHSASQDLEIFVNLYDEVPTPLFDTQIAASLLGYGDQVSYAHLVDKICNIELDKSLSRTNWERRPLSEKEFRYATDDVKYLAKVYVHLKNELSVQQRTHWVEFECKNLAALEKYKVEPHNIWKSVKGAGKLSPQQLIVLKHLAAWREQQAITENRPRRWVISDQTLRELAIEQPSSAQALHDIESVDKEIVSYSSALLNEIQQAQNAPKADWPEAKQLGPLSNEQRKLVKQAQKLVRDRAEELNISPSLLATRSAIENLIRGKRTLDVLSNWKKELVGDELVELIEANSAN